MKAYELKEYILGFGLIALVLGCICGLIFMYESYKCGAGWSRSGMDTDWGPVQGCLVQVSEHRWIPSDRVREVDLPKEK